MFAAEDGSEDLGSNGKSNSRSKGEPLTLTAGFPSSGVQRDGDVLLSTEFGPSVADLWALRSVTTLDLCMSPLGMRQRDAGFIVTRVQVTRCAAAARPAHRRSAIRARGAQERLQQARKRYFRGSGQRDTVKVPGIVTVESLRYRVLGGNTILQ